MQKIRKTLRAVSEKTVLPTNQPNNQPVITNNTDFIGPGWRRTKRHLFDHFPLRCETNFGNWKSFKNDEKCFLFHFKSFLRSQDIQSFVWTFWSGSKTTWLER